MKTSHFAVAILVCLGFSYLVDGVGIPLKFRKRAPGDGGLTIFGRDQLWLANISIGTPRQELEMIVDTGSSDTWMNSNYCTNEDCWRNFKGRKRFKSDESTSFVPFVSPKDPLAITYGNGVSVAYGLGRDDVDVSGTEISGQEVGTATNILNRALQADGILGLGPEKFIAEPGPDLGVKTVYRNLAAQGKIPKARFSIKLVKTADGGGGELRFGDPNPSDVSGEIVYTPTTSDDYWQVPTKSVKVAGADVKRNPDVVFDTGASVVFCPCGVASDIYKKIPGSFLRKDGNWTVPCDTTTTVSFNINDHEWTIPAADVMLPDEKDPDDEKQCAGSIQQYDDDSFVILGLPFIKNHLLVFDADSKQVGLAKRPDVKY